MRGDFSAAKLSLAAAPLQIDWDGFEQAKGACWLSVDSSQNLFKAVILKRWLQIDVS